MSTDKKDWKGSPNRDYFKWAVKNHIDKKHWAVDLDLVGIEYKPIGCPLWYDVKMSWDSISDAEVIAYNAISTGQPIPGYILHIKDINQGSMSIAEYIPKGIGYTQKYIGDIGCYPEFGEWEESIRKEWCKTR